MKVKTIKTVRLLSKIILGLGGVFLGLLVFIFFRIKPSEVRITDLTSNSFTVSWVSKNETTGLVMPVDSNYPLPFGLRISGDNVFYDTRDVKKAELEAAEKSEQNIGSNLMGINLDSFTKVFEVIKSNKYYVHHVTVSGLEDQKDYKILIGDGFFFINPSLLKQASTVKTLEVPSEIGSPYPAYGSVYDSEGKDTIIDELKAITDGVVYFNFYDEFTGKRSTVYSSVLNDEGSWYIDVSNAVDDDGNRFLDTYSNTITNVLVELDLQVGTLGEWKKIIDYREISPAKPLVINIPDSIQDESNPDALIRVQGESVLSSFSNKSYAEDGCSFAGFCGPCGKKVNGKWEDCNCSESTLESRGCNGSSKKSFEEQAQENLNNSTNSGSDYKGNATHKNLTCSPSGNVGDYALYGNACKKCIVKSGRSYAQWNDVEESNCTGMTDGTIRNAPVEEPEGAFYKMKYDDKECEKEKCVCVYLNGKVDVINNGSTCSPELRPTTANTEYKIVNNNICTNASGCLCRNSSGDYELLSDGSYCSSSSSQESDGDVDDSQNEADAQQQNLNLTCWKRGLFVNSPYYVDNQGTTYKCEGGTLNEQDDISISCSQGASCVSTTKRCFNYEKEAFECKLQTGGYKWVEMQEYKNRAAVILDEKQSGEMCDSDPVCLCSIDDSSMIISKGTFCMLPTNVSHGGGMGFSNNLVSPTYAQTNNSDTKEYLLDPVTGMISGLEEGVYVFEHNGNTYMFSVDEEALSQDSGNILVYIDTNDNGTYDEGTDTKVSDLGSKLTITTLVKQYKYSLKEGFNFVSFPFVVGDTESRTAASLLKTLNNIYTDSIYSISKFTGSWKVVGQNSVLYDNNDFQLIPGQGYVIKASKDVDISINGYPVKFDSTSDNANILLNAGWNLIGLYGSSVKTYTADSLIDGINNYDKIDFTADNVSKWDESIQKYEGYQKVNENGAPVKYGFNFPIETQKAYFIRILSGTGNWSPEIQ